MERALEISRVLAPDKILTTDEVLCEYLTFFAGARPSARAKAGDIVAQLIENPAVLVIPQSRKSFLAQGWNSTAPVPTKATA